MSRDDAVNDPDPLWTPGQEFREENRVENAIRHYTIPKKDIPEAREYTGPYKSRREFEQFITVKLDYVGFHAYKDAPERVAFLKHNHRHRFYVEATVQVFHDDRELEFFCVLDDLETKVIPYMHNGELGSCEMQAETIANGLLNLYGEHRFVHVQVSEDNENSGSVVWHPKDVR